MPNCKAVGARTALNVGVKAVPCPMQDGAAVHSINIDNQRGYNIYSVDLFSKSLYKNVAFGEDHEWYHPEQVVAISPWQKEKDVVISQAGQNAHADDILCSVEFFDATQQTSAGVFVGAKESVTLMYTILLY